MLDSKQVRTPVGTMWIDGSGLLWHKLDAGIVVRVEHAAAIRQVVAALTGGRPVRAVVDISGVEFANRAARDAFAQPIDDSNEVATAVVVGSSVARALGSLFLKLSRPSRPVRLFVDENEAAQWVASVPTPE